MNFFAFTSILIVITSFTLAIVLLVSSHRPKENVVWAYFCFMVSIWGLGGYFGSVSHSPQTALFWWQIANIGSIFCPVVFYHFILEYLKLRKGVLFFGAYLLAFIFLYTNLFHSNLFIGELTYIYNEFYYMDWVKNKNPIYLIFYVLFYWVLLLYSFILLLKKFFVSTGMRSDQMKYFILGMTIGWIGGHADFLIIFGINVYPFSNILIAIYPIILGYAMSRYQLMDIKIAVTRAAIFIVVYGLVLGFPFILGYKYGEWKYATWTMLVLATGGPFIYLYIQKRAEDALLREQRRYQATLRQASTNIGRIKDINQLSRLLAYIVTRVVGLEHASIYIYNEASRNFIFNAARNNFKIMNSGHPIPENSAMVQYLKEEKKPILYEQIKQRAEDRKDGHFNDIYTAMKSYNAVLVIPSFIEDRLLGIFLLGQKRSGTLFSEDDLAAFSILANQAGLAMENLKSFEQMKRAQERLFQAEKLAYIGQLASSVVHEIRNPLTAIKVFVEYLPHKFRSQDADFLKRFEEVIPREIGRIEKMVHELLDLAKPKRLNSVETHISSIVKNTLELLKDNFQLNKIEVEYECLAKNDNVLCDPEQIEQVVLNLVLNAVDAMKGGGRLSVKISSGPDQILLSIKDSGCGIAKEQLKNLFTPFQTTKKQGVGLGLIITQEIVKLHGGEIKVESEIGQGSEFIITLPVK